MDVLVTGGSRGIGRAIAVRLGADGARVAVNYLRDEQAAAVTCDAVREAGGEAFPVQGDVRSPVALKGVAAAVVERWGGLDVLVHNAAMGVIRPIDKLRVSHWDLTLETSLRPFFLLTKLLRPHLREGGSVIGITSLGSRKFTPGYAAMGAAKAGMEALVRQLAVELAPRVRVNAVCGGLIDTEALQHLHDTERLQAEVGRMTPLGRIGSPEDIAGVVRFLCSADSGWVNGEVIVADGGLSAL